MGNAKIRRLLQSETKWTESNVKKHKHNYNVHAIMRLRTAENRISYYDIMKCQYCNSFHTIPKEGAITGIIVNEKEIDMSLPVLKMFTSHNWLIGFKDIRLDDFE